MALSSSSGVPKDETSFESRVDHCFVAAPLPDCLDYFSRDRQLRVKAAAAMSEQSQMRIVG